MPSCGGRTKGRYGERVMGKWRKMETNARAPQISSKEPPLLLLLNRREENMEKWGLWGKEKKEIKEGCRGRGERERVREVSPILVNVFKRNRKQILRVIL